MTIGLDTNILVRFIVRDDPKQACRADRVLDSPGTTFFISDPVLMELFWTLRRSYGFRKEEVIQVLEAFNGRGDVQFESRERLMRAIKGCREGYDFADILIIERARESGCDQFVTFDERLHRFDPDLVMKPS